MSGGRPRRVYLEDLSEAATLRDRNWTWTQIGTKLDLPSQTLRAAFHLFRSGRSYPRRSGKVLNGVQEPQSPPEREVTKGGVQ